MLRILPAYVDLDRALVLRHDGKLDEALAADKRACALGEYWESFVDRAETREADPVRAQRNISRASELRPGAPEVLFPLARIAYENLRWNDAGQAHITALRINPTNADGRSLVASVAQGWSSKRASSSKRVTKRETLRLVELAMASIRTTRKHTASRNYVSSVPAAAR